MKIYDDTQHHQGIDLEGNDINKAKFPRIERDGLFIDEVRSNPTTGLLEIWDGTQWLGYIDTGTLPEGTKNQTLRHNGTEWVANSTLEISDGTVTIPCIGYQGAIDYNRTVLFNYQSVQGFSFSEIAGGAFNLSHGLDNGGWGKLELSGQNGNYIVELSTLQDDYFIVGYNQSSNAEFMISSECVMRLSSLRGTGTSILEATEDGTIQRSTQTIPQGLPEGTVNQTLRHDGTEWVSTSRITNVENETGSAFTISSPNVSQIASRAGTSSSYINLKHDDNGIHIYSYVSGSEQILRISPSGTAGDRLQFRTTTTYMPDEIMIRHKNFNVYQNGKIQSANLAGTGTARAVIDYNGNIMRDETIAVTPPQPIVFDKQITTPSTMVEITAAELGITSGRLTDLVKSFDPYFYDRSNDTMSTVGIQAKVITPNTVAVEFTQQYPAGTRVRVLLIIR